MTSKASYGSVDYFRIIAAVLVIMIHTRPLATYTEYGDFLLTGIIARLAVPFFFMAAGFFLFCKSDEAGRLSWSVVNRYVSRIAFLYLLSVIVYIPINVYAGNFKELGLLGLLQDIVFDGTLYHLWYFPALIMGIYITVFLYRKLSFSLLLMISSFLYMIGLLGDSYFGLAQMSAPLHALYEQMFSLFDYTRNGLFFAPIFLALGASLALRSKALEAKKVNLSQQSQSAIGFAVCLGLMLTEGMLLEHLGWPRHDSMYIFLVPAVYCLFQWLLALQGKSNRHLRQISTWLYIIHPLMIVLVRGIGKATDLSWLLQTNSIGHFISVLLLSTIASVIIVRLDTRRQGAQRRQKAT